MAAPLVTVICLSYNHAAFVEEAIESVLGQDYDHIQLICVDDASSDRSAEIISSLAAKKPSIQFLPLPQNLGNCKAFNTGLRLARGKYIIDFAADDIMLRDRIRHQVSFFESLDRSYGVTFTDAVYIDGNGRQVREHFKHLADKNLIRDIPQGNIYHNVLQRYFIPSPTMMVRSDVFDYLHGYDEGLAYEDFDFLVRSSRVFNFGFLNRVTTKVRLTSTSMSRAVYKKNDRQVHSTYLICRKAAELNETPEEDRALAVRLRHEIRQCVVTGNRKEAKLFCGLLAELGYKDILTDAFMMLNTLRLPLSPLRNLYLRLRYGVES